MMIMKVLSKIFWIQWVGFRQDETKMKPVIEIIFQVTNINLCFLRMDVMGSSMKALKTGLV